MTGDTRSHDTQSHDTRVGRAPDRRGGAAPRRRAAAVDVFIPMEGACVWVFAWELRLLWQSGGVAARVVW